MCVDREGFSYPMRKHFFFLPKWLMFPSLTVIQRACVKRHCARVRNIHDTIGVVVLFFYSVKKRCQTGTTRYGFCDNIFHEYVFHSWRNLAGLHQECVAAQRLTDLITTISALRTRSRSDWVTQPKNVIYTYAVFAVSESTYKTNTPFENTPGMAARYLIYFFLLWRRGFSREFRISKA